MKVLAFLILVILITGSLSCEKERQKKNLHNLSTGMPGQRIQDMEIDLANNFYFLTIEIDTAVNVPLWSSSLPSRFYLSKRLSESDKFEIVDNDFLKVQEILFDKNNNLWSRSAKAIYQREGSVNKKIIELPGDTGVFQFIAVDNDNNIWAGGLQTGLYKINQQLKITKYHTANSPLPTNSITNIHVDKENNIWLSLWDNKGVVKIAKDKWIAYNSSNSTITHQNIWCLVTDKEGNLWIGTGHDNKNQSLMKFDGKNWETRNPQNTKNESINGTVRRIYSDSKRIFVVSEKTANSSFSSNELLIFDGLSWKKVSDIPDDDSIVDFKVDNSRQVVWIRTLNKGIFKMPI